MNSCDSKTLHFILLSTNKPGKRANLHLATEKISFISLCHRETDQPTHLAWCINMFVCSNFTWRNAEHVRLNSASKVLGTSFIDIRGSDTFETGHTAKPWHDFAINMLPAEEIVGFILIAMATALNGRKNKATSLISSDLTETKH